MPPGSQACGTVTCPQIEQLLAETDAVAEVDNTLRASSEVRRLAWPDEA
ncbi:hypothetical protein [Pelomonas sp. Root1217]|nr:hypothetical protein [Pelomonas sp. Root1217]